MVALIVAFLIGGLAGFVAGVQNAKSQKVATAKDIIEKINK